MAQKQLLIFSWEYLGYHSVQGTALAKRPRQVAESFTKNGWQVILVHRDGTGECGDKPFTINHEPNGVTRIPVKMTRSYDDKGRNALIRKLSTLFYVAFRGDRSYRWALDVIRNFDSFGINIKPEYILGFYTPRGPLHLGNYYSKKFGVPWIADIQDPIIAGISASSESSAKKWMHNVLKTAKAIVHISPEWAAIDAAQVNLKFDTIRHAIPHQVINDGNYTDAEILKDYKDCFNVFYGGSMSSSIQSLDLLKKVTEYGATVGVKVKVHLAGNDNAYKIFKDGLGAEHINHLGWVNAELMNKYIFGCDCTLVIPWSKVRVGVPSKFYELCSYPKPIWVIGYDLGAFNTLLAEWRHPYIGIADFNFQKGALLASAKGDYSQMFTLDKCKGHYLEVDGLYAEYSKLM